MTWDQEEKHAIVVGSLLRLAPTAEDHAWLEQSQKTLMTVVALRSAAREPSFSPFLSPNPVVAKRKINVRGFVGATLVAAGALFVLGWAFQDQEPVLTFTVKGSDSTISAPQELGRVRSPQSEARTLEFSDGSVLKLAQGGSVRVREVDEHGAEVVIENGRLHSSVQHLEDAAWSVFAGPYEIQVIGTKFSTEWDPSTQKLVVSLAEGSVRVVGSDIEDHVALKPGQRFDAAARQAWKVTACSLTRRLWGLAGFTATAKTAVCKTFAAG
jgi:ferric-dicitrate binding protein FerR (iron transport regulator)